jgi:hypothetical protein
MERSAIWDNRFSVRGPRISLRSIRATKIRSRVPGAMQRVTPTAICTLTTSALLQLP